MKLDRNHNCAEYDAPDLEALLGYFPRNARDMIQQIWVFLKVLFPEWAAAYNPLKDQRETETKRINELWAELFDPSLYQERLRRQVEVWAETPSNVITRLDRVIHKHGKMDNPPASSAGQAFKSGYDDKKIILTLSAPKEQTKGPNLSFPCPHSHARLKHPP